MANPPKMLRMNIIMPLKKPTYNQAIEFIQNLKGIVRNIYLF